MSDRQRRILAQLVAEYIDQGEPVSSAILAEQSDLGLSSATVRNILARLEEQGLVRQPHTSAGRVPTDTGYRLYVDLLLGIAPAGAPAPPRWKPGCADRGRSATCSRRCLTSCRAVRIRSVLHWPRPTRRSVLQHIDFASLGGCRILVIVVAAGGQITHKVVDTESPYDSTLLTQAANYINREFGGLTLHEARAAVLERMREERSLYDALFTRALELASAGLDPVTPHETLHVQGTSFLIDELIGGAAEHDEGALDTLRALFRMIEEKQRLIELLTHSIDADGITVVIGSEHTTPDLHSFSLVASTLRRRRPDRHGRRHRPDAHALPASDLARRQHRAGDGARARRTVGPMQRQGPDPGPGWPDRIRRDRRTRRPASGTSCATGCSGPPPNSTTIASASSASKRDWSDAAAADVIRDLLPVVDDLERALEAGGADARQLPPGRRADPPPAGRRAAQTRRRTGRRRGRARSIRSGTKRSPTSLPRAAARATSSPRSRRGYRIGHRLLRPALVRVAKA